jgi:hypothetical protein
LYIVVKNILAKSEVFTNFTKRAFFLTFLIENYALRRERSYVLCKALFRT